MSDEGGTRIQSILRSPVFLLVTFISSFSQRPHL
jgi:hypothetical protein